LLGGFAYRLDSSAGRVGPAAGFQLGGTFEQRYATLGPALDLGLTVDLLFDRFADSVTGQVTPPEGGQPQSVPGTRTITDTSFAVSQMLGARVGRLRFGVAAGAGLSIGYFSAFSSPGQAVVPVAPTANAFVPFVRGRAGVDLEINNYTAVGVRAGYMFMLTTPSGDAAHLFGDLLDIDAGVFYRFR
jgi:hypothetical protein